MDTYGDDTGGRRRRRHSAEFKHAVVLECQRPGISMASVALRHQLNANMLRKWVKEAEQSRGLPTVPLNTVKQPRVEPARPEFVPVAWTAPSDAGEIRVQWQQADATVVVTWPVSAARDCAHWLRELLR